MALIHTLGSTRKAAAALEAGLGVVAIAFLPVLALVPHGVAPLIAVAGLLALGLALPIDSDVVRRYRPLAVLATLLILWGALSAAWAVEPRRSLLIALRLTGLFAAGFALAAAADRIASPRRLLWCAMLGLGIAIVMAEIQFATGGLLTRPFFIRPFVAPKLNQLVNALAILVLPLAAMLLLSGRKLFAALLTIVVAVTIFHLVGTAAKVAFAIAAVFGAGLYCLGRRAAYAAMGLSVLMILSAPLTFPRLIQIPPLVERAQEMKFSAVHRLLIWSFVGARISERPVLGWGLDSSRSIPGGNIEIHPGAPWLPLHPHNSALQVWLELGLPGAVLFGAFMIAFWRALASAGWPRLFAAAAGASLLMAFVASFGTYGIWQEWLIGTLWLSFFLILLMGRIARDAAASDAVLSPSSARRAARSRT